MYRGITAMIHSGCGRCSYPNTTENIKQKIITAKTTAKQKKPQKDRKICGFFFYTVLYSKIEVTRSDYGIKLYMWRELLCRNSIMTERLQSLPEFRN